MKENQPNWRPSASIDCLRKRARFLAAIRNFFTESGYLEVETPIMARYGVTDVYLNNLVVPFQNQSYYLQTSPEYHMKRLLAAGSGPIFQLARAFRDDEHGRWHNPEFTLLEWYQLDIDHHGLMEEMALFLQHVLGWGFLKKITYQQAFIMACDIDPFEASLRELKLQLKKNELDNVLLAEESDRDQYLFLLMSHVVEPYLATYDSPVALYDFPASQAALAQVKQGVAERFEVYFKGVELANGFHELIDFDTQQQRFQQDRVKRQEKGLPNRDPDLNFLQALSHGLPSCSGVALGIDRLFALLLQHQNIADVMAFDITKA